METYTLDEENTLDLWKAKIEELEKENKKLREKYERLEIHCNNLKQIIEDRKKENKNLKEEIRFLEECLDRKEKVNKKMREELKEVEKDLAHRDSFFSIMWDTLANEEISNEHLVAILYTVVHQECGDDDLSKKELKMVDKFRNREYV